MTTNRNDRGAASGPPTRDVPPLQRSVRSPGAWKYLANYVLLGASALLILMEVIELGKSRTAHLLGVAAFLIIAAMWNISQLRAAERKAAGASTASEVDKL